MTRVIVIKTICEVIHTLCTTSQASRDSPPTETTVSQISPIREAGHRVSAIDFFVPDEFLRRLLPSSFASIICEICGICG